jgi:hypothetical protein
MACSFLCLPSESNYTINWRVLIGNACFLSPFAQSCESCKSCQNTVRKAGGAKVSVPRRSRSPPAPLPAAERRCLSPDGPVHPPHHCLRRNTRSKRR